VSEKSAGDLSAQLIAAANRPGVDIYTKTMLWQATTMIDALSRQQPAGEAGWQSADTAPRDGTPFIGRGGVYHNMPFAVAYRPSEFKPGEPWLNLINGHRLPEHCLSLWLPMRDERSGTSEADIAAAIRAHFLEKGNYAVLSSDGVERVYYNGFSLTSLARSIFEYLNPAPTPVAHVDETRAGKEQKPSHSPHMEGRQ
jgi:hypothetical protein